MIMFASQQHLGRRPFVTIAINGLQRPVGFYVEEVSLHVAIDSRTIPIKVNADEFFRIIEAVARTFVRVPVARIELGWSSAARWPATLVRTGPPPIRASILQSRQVFPLRHNFSRLCVPQITFHSDSQFVRPRCWNRSIPRQVLV